MMITYTPLCDGRKSLIKEEVIHITKGYIDRADEIRRVYDEIVKKYYNVPES